MIVNNLEYILKCEYGYTKCGDIITIIKNESKVYNSKDLQVEVDDNGCWNVVSHKPDNNGYGQYRKKRTHVIMYEKYFGCIEDGMVVRHKCDNPLCCNPLHLEIGTQNDNIHDAIIRDRRSGCLSYEDAKAIAEYKGTLKEHMDKFDVSKDVIHKIKFNTTWKNEFSITPLERTIKILTEDDVLYIYNSKESVRYCADMFGASISAIYDIRNGRTWSSLTKHIKNGGIK